jgi:hypothetical protein
MRASAHDDKYHNRQRQERFAAKMEKRGMKPVLPKTICEQITTHRPNICFLDSDCPRAYAYQELHIPILVRTLHQCTQRIRLVDWHQFITQVVATRVQRNGEIDVQFVADLKRDDAILWKIYRFDRAKQHQLIANV